MGKDWLYWAGGGSSGGGGGGGGGGKSSSSTKRAANNSLKEGLQRNTLSGCMSAVFHLFDFHQLQFCLHKHDLSTFDHHSFLTEEQPPNVLKGLEAPRNSLEMEKEEEDDALNIIPMAIQIKTSSTTTTTHDSTNVRLSSSSSSLKARTDQDLSSSECSTSSPGGSKTPSLVARLMGLDLLPPPGSSSPSPSTQSNTPHSKSPHLQYLKQEFQNRQRINQLRSGNTRNGRYSIDCADVSGTRSLPDTPRASSSSRWSVESRLSLQINKENVDLMEFSGTRSAGRRRDSAKYEPDDGGNYRRSPSQYARQIVKQVKERVGRKVGADITNRDRDDVRGDNDRVVVLKSKKPSSKQVLSRLVIAPDEDLLPSCSPRLKPLEVTLKNKSNQVTITSFHSPRLPLSPLSVQVDAPPPHPPTPPKPRKLECSTNAPAEQKCKKVERYGARLKKKKQEEQFVRSSSPPGSRSILPDQKKKSKRTPLSSDLLISFPVKKESSQSSSRKSPQNQSQVSDTFPPSKRSAGLLLSSRSYKDEEKATLSSTPSSPSSSKVLSVLATHTHTARGGSDRNGGTPTGGGGEAGIQYSYYYNYIREILSCTGINVNAPVSLVINKCWYYSDPTRPLDPPIFNHLERTCPINTKTCSELRQRCNRKLIFDLTNEILSTMLRPTRRRRNPPMKGLIEVICTRISRFPAADCRVLEDIDALIGRDFCGVHEEDDDEDGEEELIVSELENELVDSLVQETAMWMWVVLGGDKKV